MLVLSRKINETIVISPPGVEPPITVTVVDIEQGKVRLGIVAPRTIPVHRSEVHEKIQKPIDKAKASV